MIRDSFSTFILKDVEADPIAAYQWLTFANQKLNLSPNEFQELPFFVFTAMVKMLETDKQKKSKRKAIVDNLRYSRKHFGWV